MKNSPNQKDWTYPVLCAPQYSKVYLLISCVLLERLLYTHVCQGWFLLCGSVEGFLRILHVTMLISHHFLLLFIVSIQTHFIVGQSCFLTSVTMSGLNFIDFLSPIKLKKYIFKSYIDIIPVMNSWTHLDLMCPLYAPSAKKRLSPSLICFIDVPIPLTFGLQCLYWFGNLIKFWSLLLKVWSYS